MYRDPTEFRLRFAAYQGGKLPYENGRPKAIQEVDNSDADFAKRLRSNWRLEIWDWEGSGKSVTHKMSDADNIVYPNVQTTKGGGLIDFTNPIWRGNVDPYQRAIKNNDYVPMKSEQDAMWFGPNYKKYYPGFKTGKLPRYTTGTVSESEPLYDSTIDFLKRYEGFKDTTYLDGNGIPTIGYGFTDSSLVKKGTISRAEADRRLKQEVAARESVLSKMKNWDKLSEDSKTALRSYYYNYPAGFKPTTKFMKAWNAGNYEEAIRQVDAGMYDKKNPGLRKRRLEEQALLKADPFLRPMLTIQPTPIVNQPVSTAVRPTIPAEQTVSAYDPTISPYISGKPMIKLRPRIQLPNLIELMEDSEWEPGFPELKNGKLPRFQDGDIPYITSDGVLYNINPNVVGAEQLNVRVPEVVVTGTDRRPMYQRYDAGHSVYDTEAIRNLTDWAPVVGDIGQGLDAYNAFKNKDYLQTGVLGGMLLLPNALEKSGKALLKAGLKYAPNITKNVYDISKLYTKIEDNPRLRRYANDVADLLNSNQISERVAKSVDDVDIAKQISNISNTPIAFSHANKLWIRPTITLEPLGLNYKFRSPIPIQMRAAGFYDPAGKKAFIKRNGRTPEQIKLTTYHEVSHASDNASPESVGIDFYNRKTHVEGMTPYFDLSTEKRARLLSILTDAYKHGVDINNKSAIEEFITSPNYTNRNLNSLLENYNYIFDKADDFYDLLDNGFKDGKLPMFKNGKSPIHIKPANRGKFTALKKRTGHSASWFKENGTPEQKKMAVFALNAKKWKH